MFPTGRGVAERLKKIVILGGGTAGWITAAVLARFLGGREATIELVESEDIGTIGVGEATVPVIRALNGLLGIDERDFLAHTQATFKLGIEFRDWAHLGSSHFHFFGDFGDVIEGIPPHHHWLKLRQIGDPTPLGEYCFPYVLGKLGRFAPPASDPRSPAASYRYAYHLDAGLYARYLHAIAQRGGVRRTEGKVADVRLRGEDGFIESLVLADGRRIEGDFFIDASGFRGLLIDGALGVGYEDWSQWLPCDRAVAMACESSGELMPFTVSSARPAGWQWRIPLQHRVGNGHVYCSSFTDDETAEGLLRSSLDGAAASEPRLIKFTAGTRTHPWSRNCLAIGLSAGFLEPLESSGLQLIQNAAARLIDFFPDRGFDPRLIAEYNRVARNELERIRDFLILHYCLTAREDTPFWRYCRSMTLPESLRQKIDVWRGAGRVALYTEESYQEPSWVSIFLGENLYPDRYDPFVDNIEVTRLRQGMLQRKNAIRRLAESLPTHAQYVAGRATRDMGAAAAPSAPPAA